MLGVALTGLPSLVAVNILLLDWWPINGAFWAYGLCGTRGYSRIAMELGWFEPNSPKAFNHGGLTWKIGNESHRPIWSGNLFVTSGLPE